METRLEENAVVPGTPYRLLKRLGEGAFGEVWKALHPTRKTHYALKFCKYFDDLDTLRNEAKHLDRIPKHCRSDFVALYEIHDDEERDIPFVAYEYIAGSDFETLLEDRFTETGPFKPIEAAEIIHGLARIMGAVHKPPIRLVHRDLKPSNILVIQAGRPWKFKIADLGLGVLAISSSRAKQLLVSDNGRNFSGGTRCYRSVEQNDPEHLGDPSDDVHALGVIWYQLLKGGPTNEPPFWRSVGASFRGDPPSHDPRFAWAGLRADLLGRGLNEKQAALLESCLKRHKFRPSDGADLAARIDEVYPSLKRNRTPTLLEEVKKDAAEIERIRCSGGHWHKFLKKMGKKRIAVWEIGVEQEIPEALWLKGLYTDKGVFGEGEAWIAGRMAAKDLLQRAADKGYAAAQYDLGRWYFFDGLPEREVKEEMLHWFIKAAQQNYSSALLSLGEMLIEEPRIVHGLPQSRSEYIGWLGEELRTTLLGMWPDNSDPQMHGIEWIAKAAELGNAKAQLLLAELYEEGVRWLDRDFPEAGKWLWLAAQQEWKEEWLWTSFDVPERLFEFYKKWRRTNPDYEQFLDKAIEWAEKSPWYPELLKEMKQFKR